MNISGKMGFVPGLAEDVETVSNSLVHFDDGAFSEGAVAKGGVHLGWLAAFSAICVVFWIFVWM